MRLTILQKRSVLASSSGASTSSSKQNGAGLSWNIENTNAVAVNAFSPPDNKWMVAFFLPGGCAITCTPESRISSPVIISFAWPPPNKIGNNSPKWWLTLSKVSCNRSRVSLSILWIASCNVLIASVRSSFCASRKFLRSDACANSSSAARFTAPNAAIALVKRVTSPCKYDGLISLLSFSVSAASSASASSRCCAYCSWFKRAACSFNWSSVIRSRCGCRLRSHCMRVSSCWRSFCVNWSSSWRVSANARSWSVRLSSNDCKPACAAWSFRLSNSRWPCCILANNWAACSDAVAMLRFNSSILLRCDFSANSASCAARSNSRRRCRASLSCCSFAR